MFGRLRDLFGCTHQKTTFPLTSRRGIRPRTRAASESTYVVCLDCGREFQYNWAEMRIGEPLAAGRVIVDRSCLGTRTAPALPLSNF
jgi:hypothetical protein